MTASPRRHSVPLSTVSRLVRTMSATPTLTGVIRIAADLGQRLTGLPTGVLVIDRHGVRVSAGAPVDDRYAQLFAVQSRSGPWLETFATGVAATCTYHEAQDRGWIPLATAMGYGGTSSVDAVPLRVSGEVLGVLSTFRAGELTASDMRAQDAARDFADIRIDVEMVGMPVRKERLHRQQLNFG